MMKTVKSAPSPHSVGVRTGALTLMAFTIGAAEMSTGLTSGQVAARTQGWLIWDVFEIVHSGNGTEMRLMFKALLPESWNPPPPAAF